MKKYYLFFLVPLLILGCQSREEKAQELIKQDMFKTLYDFASYEPIETKIDSAFSSIYTDTLALLYANTIKMLFENLDVEKVEYKNAKRAMGIWSGSSSSLGIFEFNDAKRKVDQFIEKVDYTLDKADDTYMKIRERNEKIGRSFIGWEARHKFRCKTRGGSFDIGNYLYVFDKDMKQILRSEDLDNKDNSQLIEIIREVMSDNFKKKNKGDFLLSTADSLANALKGGY